MTELRDIRLREAMQQAPDGGVRPATATREAIHAAAHSAVRPWWLRWRQPARRRAAWPAAFATVLVAGVVTLLWHGQEVPGPVPEAKVAAAPAAKIEASPPAAPSAPPPRSAPPTAAPAATRPRPAVAAPRVQAVPPAKPTVPAAAGMLAGEAREARSAPAAAAMDLARDRGEQAPQARGADAPLLEKSNQSASTPEPLRDALAARRAPAAVAMAPAPPPAPALVAPAAAAPPAAAWSQVRVEQGGASIVLARAQAGGLVRLLEQLLRAPSDPVAPGGAATLRFELGQGEEAIGVLELTGDGWRWLPLRTGQQARLLKPEPALEEELRKEAERVLRR